MIVRRCVKGERKKIENNGSANDLSGMLGVKKIDKMRIERFMQFKDMHEFVSKNALRWYGDVRRMAKLECSDRRRLETPKGRWIKCVAA